MASTTAGLDLQQVFDQCVAEGSTIRPPQEQLDPKLYAEMKKHFTQNRGKWKGGKLQHFEFPFPAEELLNKMQAGERPNFKREFHYFPTPPEVIEDMCNLHFLMDSHRILEPSAGQGAIIEGVNAFVQMDPKHRWVTIEADPTNREVLKQKGFAPVHDNFDTYETDERFEACFANPPFNRDTAHVEKIADLLDEQGSAVIVLPAGWDTRDKKTRALMERFELEFHDIQRRSVSAGTFKGTGVAAMILGLLYKRGADE